MQHETDAASRPVDGTPMPATPGGRISFERLRERSDELELLISGLLVFGLFSLLLLILLLVLVPIWLLLLAWEPAQP